MALILNNTFTSAFSSQAGFVAVVDQVRSDINTFFNINCTIDYRWDYGSSPGSANTSIVYINPVNYSTLRSTLLGIPSDPLKAIAYNSTNLPVSEASLGAPISGTVYQYAQGLNSIITGATWVNNFPFTYLGTTVSNTITWSTALNGSTSAGQVSLYGIVYHELSEALGRGTQLTTGISTLDLFVFKSAGVRSWAKTDVRYFSYDNGTTNDTSLDINNNLGFYNTGTGDWGGWGGTYVSPFNEQNLEVQNGRSGLPLPGDIRQLAAIGWPLSAAGASFAGFTTSSGIGHGHSFTRNL